MIEIKNLCKAFGQNKIFVSYNETFDDHMVTGISAPSGAGKTTLLNLIAGLLKPDSGEISGTAGKRLSYVFQEPRLFPRLTAAENIKIVRPKAEADPDFYLRLIKLLRIQEFEHQYPRSLSGGMQQRVSIARALYFRPDIFLLDEPSNSLDQELKESVFKEILPYLKQAVTILVSHDAQTLTVCDRIISLPKPLHAL